MIAPIIPRNRQRASDPILTVDIPPAARYTSQRHYLTGPSMQKGGRPVNGQVLGSQVIQHSPGYTVAGARL